MSDKLKDKENKASIKEEVIPSTLTIEKTEIVINPDGQVSEEAGFEKINQSANYSKIEKNLISRREQSILIANYFKMRFWKDLGMVAFSAFFVTIAFDYFITSTGPTGLFPAGLGSLARFFGLLSSNEIAQQAALYFVYYFLLNIPLMIFGIMRLGWKFTFTTFLYIVLQIAFDQIIRAIPLINPQEFHLLIDVNILDQNPASWNNSIWLFLFAIIGGAMIGTAYSFIYKIGSSTGGVDFITVWISRKKSKPLGSLNRNINLLILAVIIVLNAIVLNPSLFSNDLLISALKTLNFDSAFLPKNYVIVDGQKVDLFSAMFNDIIWSKYNGGSIPDLSLKTSGEIAKLWKDNNKLFDPEFYYAFNPLVQTGAFEFKNGLFLFDYSKINMTDSQKAVAWNYLNINSVVNGYSNLPKHLEIWLRVKFIFGPTLFASIVLVITSGILTNAMYPKYKIRTYMITTKLMHQISAVLTENGYENDIMAWDATNRINGNYLHRSVIMVSMSVMDWDIIEKLIFTTDPFAKVNVLKTKEVKGLFKFEVRKNDEREYVHQSVVADENEIEKIRQVAFVKSNRINEREARRKAKIKIKKSSKKVEN
ncbi:YitT family ABC transporter [Spiroplasma endosymbiont of Panorpa germanica]|uniref:YitT family ABC transporter n=1 Tax=Spiroplasma endosymbiont of Panorpa germanica TaxID=3066314 RepID=UPI0030CB683C